MKLTPFTRILVTVLIVAGIFFAVRYFLPQLQPAVESGAPTEQPVQAPAAGETPAAEQRATPSFNYSRPLPVDGKFKGIVELGASGFNSFIINVDKNKNWSLAKAEYGASLVYENMATEADVRAGLKQYIAKMLDYGVGGKDIHFMVSSSAIESDAVKKIRAALKSLGYVVNTVDAKEEGTFALKAVLPEDFEQRAFVVDIGSGNTKISWVQGGKINALESYGSKYYQDNIADEKVYNEVKALAGTVPSSHAEYCFIIGGIPFELAKQVRQGDERYTVLRAPDGYTPEGEKQKSGLNIYQAITDATGCQTFVFDWDANFTIGFLLSL